MTARALVCLLAVCLLAGAAACDGDRSAPAAPEEVALRLEIVSGDEQVGELGTTLDDFLVVRVTDAAGNPVRGVPVGWATVQGGGLLTVKRFLTDPEGLAAASLFLAGSAGEQRVQAEIDGGLAVTFTARAIEAEPDARL